MKPGVALILPFIVVVFFHPQLVLGQYEWGPAPSQVFHSTIWKNNQSLPYLFNAAMQIRLVLFLESTNFDDNVSFACGFLCPQNMCDRSLFAMVMTGISFESNTLINPEIIWSSNRNQQVKENATLEFTTNGDLILHDADGTFVWSTNTSGIGVTKLTLLEYGNLVLTNSKDARVWESFNYPTDTLMLGQSLPKGRTLVANMNADNSSDGLYFLIVVKSTLYAYFVYDPSLVYFSIETEYSDLPPTNMSLFSSLDFTNGGLSIDGATLTRTQSTNSSQFIRIEPDGHLKHYVWISFYNNRVAEDLFVHMDYCDYPLVCGEYGICSQFNKSCSCPDFFVNQTDVEQSNLGCSPLAPLSCDLKQDHQLVVLHNTSYFAAMWTDSIGMTTEEKCKDACLQNCSCKGAFYNQVNASFGTCKTISYVDSMISSYNSSSSMYIKIVKTHQNVVSNFRGKIIIGVALGAFVFLVILTIIVLTIRIRKRKLKETEEDDIIMEKLPGLPTRFYFTQLEEATLNFSSKLGEGGFGSVFAGIIGDEKVAVKRLDSVNQGKQEFLAEIETIGSTHHINLVRLIGFCAEKGHRLLVYEYMTNGSLDKWIFNRTQDDSLDWKKRVQIITDVAKGLSYLHEECRQRIAHLDIKPQNILLDDNFHAKVSDFGLAKLIDRDQSHVVTRMKGTRGYLAPEWLSSIITEKVDVYSFGVVIIEVVCGRKNLGYSQPEENTHLFSLLQNKIRDDRVLDIIDKNITDLESNVEEIMKMVRLAVWCLESESWIRPCMSVVVKVLEGAIDLDMEKEMHFVNPPPVLLRGEFASGLSSALSEELVSGPR